MTRVTNSVWRLALSLAVVAGAVACESTPSGVGGMDTGPGIDPADVVSSAMDSRTSDAVDAASTRSETAAADGGGADTGDATGTALDVPVEDARPALDAPVVSDRPSLSDAAPVPVCPPGTAAIPAGTFTMGSDDDPDLGVGAPAHVVRLSAYCIDLTEVTAVAFRACTAPGCTAAAAGPCTPTGTGIDDAPIACVVWSQARAYCQWRGGDLPTEAQWEHAARGGDGRRYPWGNETPSGQGCFGGFSSCPVGSHPTDVSPFGLFDMGGNVAEWVLDWFGPYSTSMQVDPTGPDGGDYRITRGGPYNACCNDYWENAAFRTFLPGTEPRPEVGLRCAYPPR